MLGEDALLRAPYRTDLETKLDILILCQEMQRSSYCRKVHLSHYQFFSHIKTLTDAGLIHRTIYDNRTSCYDKIGSVKNQIIGYHTTAKGLDAIESFKDALAMMKPLL